MNHKFPTVLYGEIAQYLDTQDANALATSDRHKHGMRALIVTGFQCQNCMMFAASIQIDDVWLCHGCEWDKGRSCAKCNLLHFRFTICNYTKQYICMDCIPTYEAVFLRRRMPMQSIGPYNEFGINVLFDNIWTCTVLSTPILKLAKFSLRCGDELSWRDHQLWKNGAPMRTTITLSIMHYYMRQIMKGTDWIVL